MSPGESMSFEEQRMNIVQLSRDRKNEIGGYHAGVRDFGEMGPPSGEHMGMSAEQIRRAFGVPVNKSDPESEYVLTLRMQCHGLLESAAEALREHAPKLYGAWDRVFDPDTSGDRDYEWYQKRVEDARRRAEIMKRDMDELPLARKKQEGERMKRQFAQWVRQAVDNALLLERCDLFIDMLTRKLMEEELVVDFATRMTRLQEEQMEVENQRIWDEYLDLKNSKPTKEAKTLVCRKHGISESTLARIEQSRRQEMGLPPRKPGRPRKEPCQA